MPTDSRDRDGWQQQRWEVHTPVVGSINEGTKPKATVATFLQKFAAAESCMWRDSGSDEHVSAADLLADMEYFGGGAPPEIEAVKSVEDEPAGPSSCPEPPT